MTYVGRGVDAISNVEKLTNLNFDGSTTYNLVKDGVAFTPSGKNNILISIDGVVQQGNFTVAGSTIIFDFSVSANSTCNFIMHYGVGVLNTPADDTVKTATVQDDAITLAKMASGTDGNIISYDASGNPVAIATGNDGQVLTSTGAGSPPAFESISAAAITSTANGSNNRVATYSDADSLNGEEFLTYNGTILGVGADGNNADLGQGIHIKANDSGGAAAANEADFLIIEKNSDVGMQFLSSTSGTANIYFGDSGDNDIGKIQYSHSSNVMYFTVNAAERMRILSTGAFLVGTTAMKADGFCSISFPGASTRGMTLFDNEGDNTANFMQFNSNGTECGRVQKNGTNSVSFTTSSDYRLKENVDYNFDATTRLKQLKPARFNWIADETNTLVDGFIAHEVSNVVPEAISGDKDAMFSEVLYTADDELPEGKKIGDVKEATKINPQGIDQSKLVPLLVKTVLELEARIKTLEDA